MIYDPSFWTKPRIPDCLIRKRKIHRIQKKKLGQNDFFPEMDGFFNAQLTSNYSVL